jgi:hypothetical protein
LAEAIRFSPVLDYARCTDASGRPADHVGDWPVEGAVYPVRVVQKPATGFTLVHILGFEATSPYYNAFEHMRFQMLCSMWLN